MKVGILALQGGYIAHQQVLNQLNVDAIFVRKVQDLRGLSGLILPGGESTTILKFLMENDFLQSIVSFALAGNFLFGTCAGAILLAKEVLSPSQSSLQLVDITIQRNAYGSQLASHIGKGQYVGVDNTIDMVFIRAPRILRVGPQAHIFATYQGEPVGVQEGTCMLTTFHPELTCNTAIHEQFIALMKS